MSSARSITAARNRRAGDPSPKLQIQPPTRPVTSISSQSAFSQNGQQSQQQQNKGNNIRVSGKQSTVQPPPSNGLPFTKLTISDAIGLVTLRLGRVEQFIMEVQENGLDSSSSSNIPENSKLVDNSVLTSIINRLDSLEKKESAHVNSDKISKIETEVESIKRLMESFTQKLDEFELNINEKFVDYENAIVDIEKEIEKCLPQLANDNDAVVEDNVDDETAFISAEI
jgi:hypothetical protein